MSAGNLEARRYRKVYVRIWSDEEFRPLDGDTKTLVFYLLTGPQTNRIGCYRLSLGAAAEDLGWKPRSLSRRFASVIATFGWRYDEVARVIWIPSWWKYNPPENRNVLVGCLGDVVELPRSPLVAEFYRATVALFPGVKLPATFNGTSAETLPVTLPVTLANSGTGTGTGVENGNVPLQRSPNVEAQGRPSAAQLKELFAIETEDRLIERAFAFFETWRELHARLMHGAAYPGQRRRGFRGLTPSALDMQHCLALASTYEDDAHLVKVAEVFLRRDDLRDPKTLGWLKHHAASCDVALRKSGIRPEGIAS